VQIFLTMLFFDQLLVSPAAEAPKLSVVPSGTGAALSWPATVRSPDGSIARPYFELQQSTDLLHWQPIGERQRIAVAAPDQTLSAQIGSGQPLAFYRLLSVEPSAVSMLGSGGAEVFGYGAAFAKELQRIGQISPDQFALMFPSPTNYLPGI